MIEENINSSAEGTDSIVNSPTQETDAEQTSEKTQTSETETPESEVAEEINWQKRYQDTQAELTKTKQLVSQFDKTEMQKLKEQDFQKYQEEQKKRLDVGTYMSQYKDNPSKGLNAWMKAREDNISQNVYKMLGPTASQTQYLSWSLSKILKKIAPEIVEEQMNLEKKIKGLYEEMPALRNTPDSMNLAEQIILSKMSKKDRDIMQKDLTKQIKKSVQQQQGVSISPSKAPTKQNVSKENAYKEYIISAGRKTTKL